jgi:precorrin-2 dehydrogenase/sirohydrochlorin ferrochelatase
MRSLDVEIRERAYRDTDLHGVFLAIIATDDPVANRDAARDARDLGCLVNVVDCPALSNFIVPATLRRGELSIAVSTGGASPALARRLREKFETEFGEDWAVYLDALAEVRTLVIEKVADAVCRAEVLRGLAHERWLEVLKDSGRAALVEEMKRFAGV